ncbi:hypothetical protein WG908_10775 [Sphingobium sp. AN641]|uniref:hypothetical protein n=1 Tax=Sphingobium sp. AN641 TaxID=3133443 RepID=UPI0030BA6695
MMTGKQAKQESFYRAHISFQKAVAMRSDMRLAGNVWIGKGNLESATAKAERRAASGHHVEQEPAENQQGADYADSVAKHIDPRHYCILPKGRSLPP